MIFPYSTGFIDEMFPDFIWSHLVFLIVKHCSGQKLFSFKAQLKVKFNRTNFFS